MSKIILTVEGMTCNHCKMRAEKAIQAVSGVESVLANVEAKEVVITGNADHNQLVTALKMAGYSVLDKPEPFAFKE